MREFYAIQISSCTHKGWTPGDFVKGIEYGPYGLSCKSGKVPDLFTFSEAIKQLKELERKYSPRTKFRLVKTRIDNEEVSIDRW